MGQTLPLFRPFLKTMKNNIQNLTLNGKTKTVGLGFKPGTEGW